ncbi:OLC1v1016049C1 [Oldenlandia corymbosa var. corymbosa]|uniref:OLC1v1016049C1 n=1 Tax=Oldenlandia corymbosa var. corymbosa TaxID=529605 RepID=A0AAV1E4U7_OLDCO|nr:OLC1v1016049C1 [Oldenlandia corymbosa var. corymbosa]
MTDRRWPPMTKPLPLMTSTGLSCPVRSFWPRKLSVPGSVVAEDGCWCFGAEASASVLLQTVTTATFSQDARLLLWGTLQISANLALTPSIANSPPSLPMPPPIERDRFSGDVVPSFGLVEDQFVNSSLKIICREEMDSRRREYFADVGTIADEGSIPLLCSVRESIPVDEGRILSFIEEIWESETPIPRIHCPFKSSNQI